MTFRLGALLRVRKNEEDEELKRFGVVNTHLVRQKESRDIMKNLEQKNSQNLDTQRKQNPDLNILRLYDNFFDAMRIQEHRTEQIISEIEERMEICREALTEAMRKRKTLEILKERTEKARQNKILKQERDQHDEAASNLWRRQFFQ